jgi:hypothetical protein
MRFDVTFAPCHYSMLHGHAEPSSLPTNITHLHQRQIATAAQIFKTTLGDLSKAPYCIATTGSDARHEKYTSLSPIEIIFLDDSEPSGAGAPPALGNAPPAMAAKVETLAKTFPALFDPIIQVHAIRGKANPLTFDARGKKPGEFMRLVIPPRALEAVHLFGNGTVMGKFQRKAKECFVDLNAKNKKNFRNNFHAKAMQDLTDCISRKSKVPVDLDSGVLFYDNKRFKSVKFPLLRAVQFQLCAIQLDNKEAHVKVLDQMPKPIAERVLWLQRMKLLDLSEAEAKELSWAYTQALSWYLESQVLFLKGQMTFTVDPKTLQKVAQIIFNFCQEKKPATAAGKN